MALQICVAGVGAVGGTVAARLAAAGQQVNLLARGARPAQLRRDGLRADFGDQPVTAQLPVSDHPDFGIQDIVFIATKSHALPGLLPRLAPLIGPDTIVAPLVNGIPWWYFLGTRGAFANDAVAAIDPQGSLRDAVAAERIVGCVVYITARLAPTGVVSTLGGQRLQIGEISDGISQRARGLSEVLSRAGIDTQVSARIREELWTKVALNLATNPLSVVTESTLVEQFTDPNLLSIVRAVLEETRRLAAAHQIRPTLSLDDMIAMGRKAGAFETSMLQDYRAGRPLELDAIGGTVLELAAKIGEDMPVTKLMIALCAHRASRRPEAAS
jgi:2-dehydropantoate 2-reductase